MSKREFHGATRRPNSSGRQSATPNARGGRKSGGKRGGGGFWDVLNS